MKTQDTIADLVGRIPELDKRGTFTGASWDETIPILDGVLAAGQVGLISVIAMLREVDDGSDYRARYVLHGLAQYVGRPGKEAIRKLYSGVLAAQLGGEWPRGARGFLARQLQVAGFPDAAPALGKLLLDPELCEDAAQALLAIREGAAEQFRKALPEAKGGPRLTILQALGVLGDAESAGAMRAAVADPDREIRLAAGWGLARLGDAGSVPVVLKAADVEAGYERIKATSSALHLAENLAAAGKKGDAAAIYRHLQETRTDPSEAYVREIAAEGLARSGG